MLHVQIREGARDLSRSSNARTRDDCEPGRKREGWCTQEGSWQTLRWHREGLLSISDCQRVCSGVILSNASRYRVNHDLAPFDIQAGRDLWVIWQGTGYSGGEKRGSGKECVVHDIWSSKNDQVPLGRPLCSGNLNIGVDRISGKGGIANVDQDRGSKNCSGPQG